MSASTSVLASFKTIGEGDSFLAFALSIELDILKLFVLFKHCRILRHGRITESFLSCS